MNIMMEGWIDIIQQFNFTTEYVPGEDNVMADALSHSLDQLSSAVIVKQATLVSATNTKMT